DQLDGGFGNDTVIGGLGDDYLAGGDGDDVLDGGAGNDYLRGGFGNDTYLWGIGSGKDMVTNEEITIGRKNVLKIGEGIRPSDLWVRNERATQSVILGVKNKEDTFTIFGGFDLLNTAGVIQEFIFADGTVWTHADLKTMSLIGTENDEEIFGFESDDVLGGNGGDDTLFAGVGRDTLDGGTGNDQMSGGWGSDTYIFGRVSGNDVIHESNDLDHRDLNVIQFEPGISLSDISFDMVENGSTVDDLLIKIRDTSSSVVVKNFFREYKLSNGERSIGISQLVFSDGTSITRDEIRQSLIQRQITAGNDVIHGFEGSDVLEGGAGDDTIEGYLGDDVYKFGRSSGNDTFFELYYDLFKSQNIILLDNDVKPEDVQLKRDTLQEEDVLLSISGSSNTLRLQRHLGHFYLGKIQFSDGTSWDYNEVFRRVNLGTSAVDLIVGTSADETFDGLGGDDRIEGGAGGDTYLFDRNSGNDTILDRGDSLVLNNSDKVQLGVGILPSDVKLRRQSSMSPNDILLSISGSASTLTIQSGLTQNYDGSFNYAIETIRFADGTEWNWSAIKQKVSQGTNTDDIINGFIDSDDELDGAGGNDRMEGYDGSDTYIFGRNYGNDFIEDYDQAGIGSSNDLDVVKLAAGVLPEDVLVSRDSNESLILTIQGTADKLTIYRYFDKPVWANGASPFQIEKIQFENGIVWDYSAVLAAFMRGTNGDDSIYGKETDDTINGFGGNDLVFGAGGNDRLYGGDGNDTVVGGDGDDIVDGNSGNDELRGGDGFDQYIFGRQSGNDLINDGDNQSVIRRDQIVLDSDIAPADISLSRDGSGSNIGLVISIAGSSSSLKIYPYFYGTELNPSMRQEILFADGTIWNAEQIKDLSTPVANRAPIVSEPIADQAAKQNILFNFAIPDAAFKDLDTTDVLTYSASLSNGSALPSWLKFNASTKTFSGTPTVLSTVGVKVTVRDKEGLAVSDAFNIVVGSSNQVLNGTNGTDNLIGNIGNDTLTGFAGNDALFGGRGNDIYVFNRGDGQDTIDNLDLLTGTDTLRFATGVIDTDVLAFKSGNHLAFKLKNSTDQVVIANYYAANTTINGQAADYKIDKVEFSNAVSWNQSMIQTMVDRATNNKAPTLGTAVPNQNSKVDVAYSFTVPVNTIVDADVGDTVTYSLKMQDGSALPTWLSFNAATRIISGTPTLSNLGSLSLTLWGTDNYGTALGQNLSMTVNPANRAPVVAVNVPDQMASQGAAFNYTIPSNSFSDPDVGDVLTYSATLVDGTALPSWLTLNATTGAFSGTPISVGTLSIKVTAKDSGNLNASDVFDLTVNVSNLNLTGTTGADTLTGGVGNDSLSGLAGNDKLTGNAGNDSLDGGAGSDTLIGGLGDDIYIVDVTTDVVTENANEGTDTIKSSVTLTLAANVENLTLSGTTAINGTGNALNNVLTGNSAVNTLNGGVGADTLAGAAGNDIYVVDNINDMIVESANEGTDQVSSSVSFTLSANTENLTLTGTASINATGNTAVNTLTGNAGNNVIDGGAGNDSMAGGAGNDTYVVDSSGDTVTEAANAGTDMVQSSVSYSLGTNLENLTLTGTANINATGNTAANILFGNSGNNVLDGGAGADAMSGGAGNDIYVLDNASDVITENGSEGIDQVKSSLTYTLIANLESLLLTGTTAINGTGNALDNLLIGNSGKNVLNGGAGNDILQGVAGDDTLTDTTGNNIFDGGAGIDVITAGIGNDFIVGGLGNDTITTSTGVDVVAFNRGDGMDTLVASTGKDNTLSLGKGIKYADLLFKKSGNDLILVTGTSEQVTMKDWYTNVNNRSIANLQIVIEGTTDYNAASTNKLNNKKIEQFNFDGLVTKFDQARAANPSLTSWALSSSLLEFYLNSSDTAAIGGDLAYQYAKSGNLSAFSMTPAQALLSSAQYGNSAQALQSTTSLQDASVRLM
ncbi:calcium-binding protein, partial [Undibacterium amnicola]